MMFVRRRSRRRIEYAAFFILSSLMLTWTYARLSSGFGGFGGTVDVSRYSVWLIFLFFRSLAGAGLVGRQSAAVASGNEAPPDRAAGSPARQQGG